ncbi:RNA-binding protein with serine-rich domain 1, protein [Aphelenchoides bicaudatus]|nr:RNA-binding protein with serine-rich domain 1, protein [Aphelenchoides bicaudatus]
MVDKSGPASPKRRRHASSSSSSSSSSGSSSSSSASDSSSSRSSSSSSRSPSPKRQRPGPTASSSRPARRSRSRSPRRTGANAVALGRPGERDRNFSRRSPPRRSPQRPVRRDRSPVRRRSPSPRRRSPAGRRRSPSPVRRRRDSPPRRRESPPARREVRRSRSKTPPPRKITVKHLSRNVNKDHLSEIFGHYGEISLVDLLTDHVHPYLSRGQAYIEFENNEQAEKAVEHMHGAQIDGMEITCEPVTRRGGGDRWRR